MFVKKVLPFALFALLFAGLVWHERLPVYDWWRLRGYRPSAQVQQLADQTTMTPYARHLFYVYHPQLENSSQFNQSCSVTQGVTVLGCTVSFQGIYLYNIQDPQLNGIVQVTAAYEMLHVGYSRLSTNQRKHIDQLVMQQFTSIENSQPELKQEEQTYLKTEGQVAVANELHSMMGTEVAHLSPELEAYYKQYFSNRQAIISLHTQYEAVFTQQQQAVTQDDAQLANLKATVMTDEASLKTQTQQLASQKAQMDGLLKSGQTSSYNVQVGIYNKAVGTYNALVSTTQQLITQYNQLLQSRNQAALQINQLNQAISSQPLEGAPTTLGTQ